MWSDSLLALVFIIASATLEAVNSYNYLAPLITFTLPEYLNAFGCATTGALACVDQVRGLWL